jgi:hypothetical protein
MGRSWRQQRALLRGPARLTLLSKGPRRRRKRRRSEAWGWGVGIAAALGIAAYWYIVFGVTHPAHERQGGAPPPPPPKSAAVADAPKDVTAAAEENERLSIVQESILNTAKGMVARGVRWDGGYHVMRYPGGDFSPNVGTGVDVLVRALRGAGIDLQRLIHEDRLANPQHYPLHRWRRKTPDTNIDHRRLAMVWAFFNRYAVRLDAGTHRDALADWRPADIVFWGEGNIDQPGHVGVVTDRRDAANVPYVIELHKDRGVISDQRLLTERPIMGHFRIAVERLPEPGAPVVQNPLAPTPPGGGGAP